MRTEREERLRERELEEIEQARQARAEMAAFRPGRWEFHTCMFGLRRSDLHYFALSEKIPNMAHSRGMELKHPSFLFMPCNLPEERIEDQLTPKFLDFRGGGVQVLVIYEKLFTANGDGELAALWIRKCFTRRTCEEKYDELDPDHHCDANDQPRCEPFIEILTHPDGESHPFNLERTLDEALSRVLPSARAG